MKAALKSKRKRLIISFVCLALAIFGTVMLAIAALSMWIWSFPILIPLTAFGYYGMAFFFAATARAACILNVVRAVEKGYRSFENISKATGLKLRVVHKYLYVALSRRYINDCAIGTDTLVSL